MALKTSMEIVDEAPLMRIGASFNERSAVYNT